MAQDMYAIGNANMNTMKVQKSYNKTWGSILLCITNDNQLIN
jgi:hypothetical protein